MASRKAQRPTAAPSGNAFDIRTFMEQWLKQLQGYARRSPLTIRAYRADVEKFGHFLETHRLPTAVDEINERHVRAFAASLVGKASATINRALDAISSFFGHLVRTGVVALNPVSQVERPRRPRNLPRAATVEQCRALVAAAETACDRAMILMLLGTGIRRGELLALDLTDLSADLSEVRIKGKGGRERLVPIPQQCREALKEYLDTGPSDTPALLVNRVDKPLGTTPFARWFKRLLRRAGPADSDLTPHSLRHSQATQLLRGGADVERVRELMAHSSVALTCKYFSTDPSRKRTVVEALPDFTGQEVGRDE